MNKLGVTYLDVGTTRKGARVTFQWLKETYKTCVVVEEYIFVTRAFFLHLIDCMIFADKSSMHVQACYLELFHEIESCDEYSWGFAALTYLYNQLSVANLRSKAQFGGYISLLMMEGHEGYRPCIRDQGGLRSVAVG